MRAIIMNRPDNPAPEVIEVENDYRDIQKHVGGHFDVVYIAPDRTEMAFVHDEGLLDGLPPMDVTFPDCRKIRLCGPILVLGGDMEGDQAPTKISPDDIVWSIPDATFEGMETTEADHGNWFEIRNTAKWSDGYEG